MRGAGGVCLLAAGLTVFLAAPVLLSPSTRLFGSEIVGRHEAPFIVGYLFENPRGLGPFTQPVTDYLGAVVAAVTGDGIRALNLVVLASFPLAVLFAYLLAFRLTASRPAAWIAGLLYGFAPFHIAQSAYHPHGSQTQWLPLYLLALWLCLEGWTAKRVVLLAAATALVVLSNYYYGLIAALVTPLVVAGFCLGRVARREPWARNAGATLASLVAVAAGGLAYVAYTAPTVFANPRSLAFPHQDLLSYGARWWSYWVPPVEHPLLGSWVLEFWNRRGLDGLLEQQITVGVGLLLASIVTLSTAFRRDHKAVAAIPALVLVAIGAFWLSLSPATTDSPSSLLRPSGLIYDVLPMFRAYARFALAVFLALAILAAIGLTRLAQSRSRTARLAAAALGLLIGLELTPWPPFRWRDVLPTSAHRWLEQQTGPLRVMDCVPAQNTAQRTFFLRFKPEVQVPGGVQACADPGFLAGLKQRGFSHLLVRKGSSTGDWISGSAAPERLTPVGAFDDALLFTVDDRPPLPLLTSFMAGFHWREFKADRTYRWMTGEGALAVVNTTDGDLDATLEIELHAFVEPRRLDVSLDQTAVGKITVETTSRVYSLGPLTVTPGSHVIRLKAQEPATVAAEVLDTTDQRALTVAVWDVRWSPKAPEEIPADP